MKLSKFAGSFWLACGLLGTGLLVSIQAQSDPQTPLTMQAQAPTATPSATPTGQPTEANLPESAPPPTAVSALSATPVIPSPPSQNAGASGEEYAQMIPKNLVFGCDDPGASLRSGNNLNGGTTNNALIATQTSSSGNSIYGQQQGDLVIFQDSTFNTSNLQSQSSNLQSPAIGSIAPLPPVLVTSGAARCGQTARFLNYFVQNPGEFKNFVFRVNPSSTPPMICYAPSGAPCEDERARLVMLLPYANTQNPPISPLESLQRFTANLNLMRNAQGSPAVRD